MSDIEPFEMQKPEKVPDAELVVDLDGYEGPIDVLLTLAREQKVDITESQFCAWPINIWPSSPRRAA